MLTKEKLAIYQKYLGDLDGLSRGDKADVAKITDDEWEIIDRLLLDLFLVNTGKASDDLKSSTQVLVSQYCVNQEVADKLNMLSIDMNRHKL